MRISRVLDTETVTGTRIEGWEATIVPLVESIT